MTAAIQGPSREATAELVAQLATAGRDDPRIAVLLGITAEQVRDLRQEFGITAGERRWLPAAPKSTEGGGLSDG